MPENKEKIFLISPVRSVTPEIHDKIAAYVAKLESDGHLVHWPERDTPQDDPVGIDICHYNCSALTNATRVDIWYDPTSTGSVFDLGMAFALNKRLVLANPSEINPTQTKSFNNVILTWSFGRGFANKD